MGMIAGVLSAVGLGMQAYGQYTAGQDARKVYQYNQQLAKYEAQYIQDAADIETAQLEREVDRYIGRQRAIAGKSGLSTGSTSNLKTIEATEKEAALDAAIIRYKADIGSWSANAQANLLGTQASQFNTASYITSGSTLLTGASKWDYRNLFNKSSSSVGLTSRQQRLGV